jgi:AcrR family transcriptional regulator
MAKGYAHAHCAARPFVVDIGSFADLAASAFVSAAFMPKLALSCSKRKYLQVVKSDDRRAVLLDRMADHILAHGISESSLRPLAKAAKTSDRMLLYYFSDKSEMIAATLEHIAQRLALVLSEQGRHAPLPIDKLIPKLFDLLCDENLWPYMRVWLEIAALAAKGDPVCRAVGENIARGFLFWGAAQLDSPTVELRNADAARLLVTIEGMMLLKSVGLEDVCRAALA